jgi:hypothetical protein
MDKVRLNQIRDLVVVVIRRLGVCKVVTFSYISSTGPGGLVQRQTG